jgi:hypothetical protein
MEQLKTMESNFGLRRIFDGRSKMEAHAACYPQMEIVFVMYG